MYETYSYLTQPRNRSTLLRHAFTGQNSIDNAKLGLSQLGQQTMVVKAVGGVNS
jgi:hypothetical protein